MRNFEFLMLMLMLFRASADLNFFATADTGQSSKWTRGIARQMNQAGAEDPFDFGLLLGDNIYRQGSDVIGGATSSDDPKFKERYLDIFSYSNLQVPFYVVIGNHDLGPEWPAGSKYKTREQRISVCSFTSEGGANTEGGENNFLARGHAHIDYTQKDPTKRWTLPNWWYSKRMNASQEVSVEFVFVDTQLWDCLINTNSSNPLRILADRQKEWFIETLEASTATWLLVGGHFDIQPGGDRSREGPRKMQNPATARAYEIRDILEKYKVDAYYCGHRHVMATMKKADVNYFVVGATSMLSSRDSTATYERQMRRLDPDVLHTWSQRGFATNKIIGRQLVVTYHNFEGQVIYKTSLMPNTRYIHHHLRHKEADYIDGDTEDVLDDGKTKKKP